MNLQQEQARILIECLPYIREFRGETIVIKYGGHAMVDETLKRSFALNVVLLKYIGMNPVIVHGGGPQINSMLDQLNIPASFRQGMRVTDSATMDVVEMVLVGKINKEIVNLLNTAGGRAVGLSGKDGQLLQARKLEMVISEASKAPEIIDLGKVGEVTHVQTDLLHTLTRQGFIPVIAPVGVDAQGETYNINADDVAASVAMALKAKRMLMLTDVPGILNMEKQLIRSLYIADAVALLADGTISAGMIPKVKCCLEAVQEGVEKAMILDGRVENCLLLELFTNQGIGTELLPQPANDTFIPMPEHGEVLI